MATSISTDSVVNWAYQYSLACAKLSSAESAASSSATRSEDIAAAKASFNATMKSLVPTEVQDSVQFQYMDALTAYNTEMAAADTQAERQAAMTNLYSTLEGITMPTATASTLDSLASNAAAQISAAIASNSAMVSNASSAWLSAVTSGANSLNSAATSLYTQLGLDTATMPTITTKASSAFAAASGSAAAGGTTGSILNAALIGYLVAEQAATATDSG
ncbi:MAG: hypothetical protein ACP59X_05635 [Solidesulfovibrio sp. DCME]|uniref:hypothetical protein n=1 Tax=Solidesulfovibrio sp. DCME TaxID=3447380 RepID=UPI003D0D1DC4